jgi:cell filamentation protein
MSRIYSELLNYHSLYEDENGVLVNKLGIKTTEELQQAEKIITTKKLSDLYNTPGKQTFDIKHYLSIHEYLFGDIYEFAGKIRSENIEKSFMFCLPQFIYSSLNETLSKAKNKCKKIKSRDELLVFIAEFYSTLDVIHPFREGNGRTEREYTRQFMQYICKQNGLEDYFIDYSLCTREEYLEAVILADTICDYKKLISLFDRIMITKEKSNDKNKKL